MERDFVNTFEYGDNVPMATTRQGTGAKRAGEPTLTAADWAEAALQLVAEKGLEALTVDTLARRLGVTKGSFYWHFGGRSDLLAAALERWEKRSVTDAVKALEAVGDARARLGLILEQAGQPPRSRSLYAALAGAADDPVVGPVLARVAEVRVRYLERCYRDLGLDRETAAARALFAYAAYRGLLQLAREAPGALPRAWSAYTKVVADLLVPPAGRAERRLQG
jgi:AcrR family transcriptional regulator